MDYWRERNWMWERFGEKVPMRDADLWKRIDNAIQIHDVRCRTHRIDGPQSVIPKPKMASSRMGAAANATTIATVAPCVETSVKTSDRPSRISTPSSLSRLSGFAADRLQNMAAVLNRFAPEATDPYPTA